MDHPLPDPRWHGIDGRRDQRGGKMDDGPSCAQKSVQQIRAEWEAIEASRPGGQFDVALGPLEEAARSRELRGRERHLIEVIHILHEHVQSYHVEMGVLLRALTTQTEALREAVDRYDAADDRCASTFTSNITGTWQRRAAEDERRNATVALAAAVHALLTRYTIPPQANC